MSNGVRQNGVTAGRNVLCDFVVFITRVVKVVSERGQIQCSVDVDVCTGAFNCAELAKVSVEQRCRLYCDLT